MRYRVSSKNLPVVYLRWIVFLALLLCSCATQREAESPDARQLPKLYPPAVYTQRPLEAGRLSVIHPSETGVFAPTRARAGAAGRTSGIPTALQVLTKTVYLPDTAQVDSLHRELQVEQLANQALRKRLTNTEADRDYWQDKNEQKFWTLIAMAVFGFLYILFKVLAARVRDTDT